MPPFLRSTSGPPIPARANPNIKECALRNSNLIEEVRRFAATITTASEITARGVTEVVAAQRGGSNIYAAATLRSCVDARIQNRSGVG